MAEPDRVYPARGRWLVGRQHCDWLRKALGEQSWGPDWSRVRSRLCAKPQEQIICSGYGAHLDTGVGRRGKLSFVMTTK